MSEELRTRTLVGPADPAPARGTRIPPARASAADLIARAENSQPSEVMRPRRSLLLAGAAAGAVAVAGAAGVAFSRRSESDDGTSGLAQPGVVLSPIAYQYASNPPPAAQYLRALAARIANAPYDTASGRYAFHRIRMWGTGGQGRDADIPLETESWVAVDGSGAVRAHYLPPEFADEQSRRRWQNNWIDPTAPPPGGLTTYPPGSIGRSEELPSDRRRLAERMQIGREVGVVVKYTGLLFEDYLVPRETRAAILKILADQSGLVWRGRVIDRAGRAGVAVSGDGANEQAVLVFDARTGVLLAQEYIQQPGRPRGYTLLLNVDRADRIR